MKHTPTLQTSKLLVWVWDGAETEKMDRVLTNKIAPHPAACICFYIVYGNFCNTIAAEERTNCMR